MTNSTIMFTIEYEQSLIETAVFLAVRKDMKLECAFHLTIDPLYEIPDEELRQREFTPVFRDYFTKLKLDQVMGGLITERPLISQHVDRCIVREAARAKDESAELFVRESDDGENTHRTLVVQVCPQSLIEPERIDLQMRRELLHVSDMLDEKFGYEPEAFDGPLSMQNLQRDRYRVLWDTYVEGRLHRRGFGTQKDKLHMQRAFDRVFTNDDIRFDAVTFCNIFDATNLQHNSLMNRVCRLGTIVD